MDKLIGKLGDKKLAVRVQAAEALGRVGGARAVDPLIAALNDAGPGVRLQAAEALGVKFQ